MWPNYVLMRLLYLYCLKNSIRIYHTKTFFPSISSLNLDFIFLKCVCVQVRELA